MDSASESYRDFIVGNRVRVNRYLNTILWLFTLTGPALALGVGAGVFPHVEYGTCLLISLMVIALSAVHLALVKLRPDSMLTSLFALIVLDILIVYLVVGHVSIRLTWFLVPLLSLLFCDKALYLSALIMNYALTLAATWMTAPYYADLGVSFESAQSYFLNTMGGFTIETLVMALSGFLVVKLASDHFAELIRQRRVIEEHEEAARERVGILDSMVEIYDNVNLISFVDSTEMSLRDAAQTKHYIDMKTQTHTLMNQRIKEQVIPEQLESFLTFTNITTVKERLRNKKIISADFIDVVAGWFRAQYITVEQAPDGTPNVVIYTTRNVDEEKRREEHLIMLSMTDEMTRLYNRRHYEDDLSKLRGHELASDLVVISVDVNGLKTVNDTLGHAAGDELIKGAAECLAASVGRIGKAYRTGGDEFMAIVHSEAPEKVREKICTKAMEWSGSYTDKLAVSVGYAAYASYPGATVDDLEHKADADMYAEKERYYRDNGLDRRRNRPAAI